MSPFHSDEYRGLVATWNPDWFKGLRLQRRLFNTFIPELAGIHSQKKHPPFTTDRGTIRHQLESLFYQNMRLLRGSMTDYSNIVYHPDFKKFMFEVFTCKNDEFDSLFDTQKIIGLFHQAAHLNCKWWLNLLKIKLFFDEVKQ